MDPSLFLLIGGAVGLSPQSAGSGQAAAGNQSGTDIENHPAAPLAVEDVTPPRLVRIEWPIECLDVSIAGCVPSRFGPDFIFDEPIDCNSIPHLNGNRLESGGTIKAYIHQFAAYLPAGAGAYGLAGEGQSVVIEGECQGNRVRMHPLDNAGGFGSYGDQDLTFVLVGGVKDLAGNISTEGEHSFAGPVGDIRPESDLHSLVDWVYGFTGVTNRGYRTVGPYAVRGNPPLYAYQGLRAVSYIDNSPSSDGRLRIHAGPAAISCEDTAEMRKVFSIETISQDDLNWGKPMQPFAIAATHCESASPGWTTQMVIDPPIPPGSLMRLRVDGNLTDTSRSMTLGWGKYMQVLQDVNGSPQPVPRSFHLIDRRWPENLGDQPQCKIVEMDQASTYFDDGASSLSCSSAAFSSGFNTAKPSHYYYQGSDPVISFGYCVDYSGQNWRNILGTDPEASTLRAKCEQDFLGLPSQFKNKAANQAFEATAPCHSRISVGGSSYMDTGVAGLCIQNPGKPNETVITYFEYDDRAAARAACNGIWRESGPNFAEPNFSHAGEYIAPGTVRKVPVSICPNTSPGGTGSGVGTSLPAGQTCEGRSIEIDTSAGKWFATPDALIPNPGKPGKITHTKGIHTYWQDQPLILRIKKNCQEGYYKVTLKGMNFDGPLPDFYKAFAVSVKQGGDDVGAVLIPASDSLYSTGSVILYLKKGDNEFDLRWLNDAYKEKTYDANFQLNGVSIAFVPNYQPSAKLAKSPRDFCELDGRFFFGDKTAWTSWANQQITYCFPKLRAGKYEVLIKARNRGRLPDGYTNFAVNVAADGVDANLSIPASNTKSGTGKAILDLTEGDKKLSVNWTNDVFISEDLDSAIEFESISIKRVGESERSKLAASLLQAGSARTILIAAIVMAVISAAGIFAAGRWKAKRPSSLT